MKGDSGQKRRLEQVKRSQRVHFEVEKRNRRGAIVRWLGSRMDDQVRLQFLHQRQHGRAVADVDCRVAVVRNLGLQLPKYPACIALGTEENRPMVAVDSGDGKTPSGEPACHLRTYQAAGASHKNCPPSFH